MKKRIASIFFAVSAIVLVSGCSSGGGDSTSSASATLAGTAATGAAIAGTVYVKDAKGVEKSIATGTNGSFTLDVAGMTPAYLLKVVPDNGTAALYSYATTNGQTVNLTPTTNLAMFLAYGKKDLNTLYTGWNGKEVSEGQVAIASGTVRENLRSQLTSAGIDADSFDIFTTVFKADSTGFDGILDNLTVTVDAANRSVTVEESGSILAFNEVLLAFDPDSISIQGVNGSMVALTGAWTTDCYTSNGGSGPDMQETLVFYKDTVRYSNRSYASGSACSGDVVSESTYAGNMTGPASAQNNTIAGWIDGMGNSVSAPNALDGFTDMSSAYYSFATVQFTEVDLGANAPAVGTSVQFAYAIDNTDPVAGMYLYRTNTESVVVGEAFDRFSRGFASSATGGGTGGTGGTGSQGINVVTYSNPSVAGYTLSGVYQSACYSYSSGSRSDTVTITGSSRVSAINEYTSADCSGQATVSSVTGNLSVTGSYAMASVTDWVDSLNVQTSVTGADGVTVLSAGESVVTTLNMTVVSTTGTLFSGFSPGITKSMFYMVDDTGSGITLYKDYGNLYVLTENPLVAQ